MTTAFFEIEDWEINYVKKSFGGAQDADLFFFKGKLNKDNLPEILRQSSGPAGFDIISVFVGSEITKEAI